ncbi:GNAT family N-acetyltransferase [Paludibacterium paludis]|uniref:GNAT family N-acetyltransferase n=1 Tax=Paludibacterium paludis TaxID=1225769 RepID=UPI0016771A87|nr:GNAT family N-acetyltransferase [Paludibacterium paludis]
MIVLETPRLTLSELGPEDAAFIFALMNDKTFVDNIGDRGLRTGEDARVFIETRIMPCYTRHRHGLWRVSLKDGGGAIGICGLLYRDALDVTDVGYALLPAFTGQGLGFEAARACVEYGRLALGKTRIVGLADPGNAASVRILEKLGMRYRRHVALTENTRTGLYE